MAESGIGGSGWPARSVGIWRAVRECLRRVGGAVVLELELVLVLELVVVVVRLMAGGE